MRATWYFICIMAALWAVGLEQHTTQPTWGQLWIGLAVWAAVDALHAIYQMNERRRKRVPVVIDHPHPA